MAKIDLDSLNIEQLVTLRDDVTEKLLEKVAARQVELEAELEKLSQYGKTVRKSSGAAPSPKGGKAVDRKVEKNTDATIEEIKQAVAEAA
jgi:chromosomal replication initiation ATPase DnaA